MNMIHFTVWKPKSITSNADILTLITKAEVPKIVILPLDFVLILFNSVIHTHFEHKQLHFEYIQNF